MKYTIYLFTLALTLNACCCKKKAMKKEAAPQAQKVEEKKELTDEERRAGIADQMKNEQRPNIAEDYYKYVEKEIPSNAIARIQRTNCFGRCPVYILTVFKDGRLEYFGKKFTPREGKYNAKVDIKMVEKLIEKSKEIDFNGLENIYDKEAITDLPSTITSIRTNGQLKTIVNRFDAPQQLRKFETFFDELFKEVEWTSSEEE